ncbi:MAG TPA: ribonuclease III [Bacilli bacterium]|jgi:ribonuclease-3|nr:MAG: Ribonuclease 3 [Tenericutes bacterium ADurb.Bin024]HOE53753.1 ribonuclease III [Bacilli bacterium]HOQ70799.1 ribonuclease III [Bacilli bacterium]HPK28557.1 ribonuclease III [Bacilli bacterium]
MSKLNSLFTKLGITPSNEGLFEEALTHSSYKTKDKDAHDYERLEFLGDAILNMLIASAIYKSHPDKKQGELTNMRKNFVRTQTLATLGRKLELERYIRTGKSITPQDLYSNDKYFEDVFEALIGAMYLDQGLKVTEDFILRMLGSAIEQYDFNQIFDYISTLQEFMQADKRGLPQYITEPSGYDNKEEAFISTVTYDGIILGCGYGANSKEAEQNAAKNALEKVAR